MLSLANSAAILRYPETHFEWVRPGIMLYGCSPFAEETGSELGLRPAMTLASELIAVQNLKRGDTVGYGGTFTAEREMKIGVVACGYADGYPRHAPNGTPVAVDGRLTGTVGRVSMDLITLDVSDAPSALQRPGESVDLIGPGRTIDDVAADAGTIAYEILTSFGPRYERRYSGQPGSDA